MSIWRPVVAVLLAVLVLSGCGDSSERPVRDRVERLREDARALRERAEERVDRVRDDVQGLEEDARRIGRDLEARVRRAFEDLERAVPRADGRTAPPRGAGEEDGIDAFLTGVLGRVDRYWSRTFAAADLPEPRVGYRWLAEGETVPTGCGSPADDTSAFYCPGDDTIYVGRRIADGVFRGVLRGFPGEAAEGRAIGDFGVAYIVAHEYAHNLQAELGVLDSRRRGASARPFELQADCLAGAWGASAYRAGELQEGDVEEALSTALAVGDFEVGSQEHHGTPEERRDAWLVGFETGEPRRCSVYLEA
ncbi:MAG: hypothetical protein F2817_06955 [Actinobacteria bacterium]|nr:hypothetical protein [Actinomycetota bacterium]